MTNIPHRHSHEAAGTDGAAALVQAAEGTVSVPQPTLDATLAGYDLTDVGNAQRMIARH